MPSLRLIFVSVLFLTLWPETMRGEPKKRIFVVDSYHRDYLWSQETQNGLAKGLLEGGLLDNETQISDFNKKDTIESSKAVLSRMWMDTKKHHSRKAVAKATSEIVEAINNFGADIVFLGDDNAANYIGNQFIDTKTPIVFWGINGAPNKYGLLDSMERPGHNVTGIYQKGYYLESLKFLKEVYPSLKKIGILSDDTPTGRSKAKMITALLQTKGHGEFHLEGVVITNDYSGWKKGAMDLEKKVDAFFVLNHHGLLDQGNPVDGMKAGRWYLENIRVPECSDEKQFVKAGMLLTVDDSGYLQGYEAAKMGLKFLKGTAKPEETPPLAPEPGPRVLNSQRASFLKIIVKKEVKVDEVISESMALK